MHECMFEGYSTTLSYNCFYIFLPLFFLNSATRCIEYMITLSDALVTRNKVIQSGKAEKPLKYQEVGDSSSFIADLFSSPVPINNKKSSNDRGGDSNLVEETKSMSDEQSVVVVTKDEAREVDNSIVNTIHNKIEPVIDKLDDDTPSVADSIRKDIELSEVVKESFTEQSTPVATTRKSKRTPKSSYDKEKLIGPFTPPVST